MTELKFNEIVEDRIKTIKSTLIEKGKEYRRNNDIFHNFNVGAKITSQSREKVLYGFMLKHLISFQDIINDIEQDKLPTTEHLEEKVSDIVNYMILFEASVKNKITIKKNNISFISEKLFNCTKEEDKPSNIIMIEKLEKKHSL